MSEKLKEPSGLTQDVSEQVLSCPICTDQFATTGERIPKVLPCHHGLCERCMRQLAAKSRGVTITCPTCRMVSNVPVSGGVSSLPNNYVILELLDIVKKHESETEAFTTYSSRKRRALTCCYCDKPTTESTCMGCDLCDGIWCNECQDIHVRGKIYKSHTFLAYSEYLEKAETQQSANRESLEGLVKAPRCKKHVSKDVDIFCVDCEEIICYICCMSDHSGHHSVLIDEAATSKRRKLEGIQGEVRAHQSAVDTAAVSAGRNRISYERHVAGLEARIRLREQELQLVISRKAQAALSELRERTAGCLDRLGSERNRLDSLLDRVRESIQAAGSVILSCDFDVCRSAPEMEQSLVAISTEIEQRGELMENMPHLAVVADDGELVAAVARAFGIVDVGSLPLHFSDVSSVRAVEAAMTQALAALQTAAPRRLGLDLQCTVTHVLDGVYSLAWSDPSNVRELGAANVCTLLVAVLASEGVRMDPVLVEKGLQAAAALCRFKEDSFSSDMANIAALGEAGIWAELIAALRNHASCVGVCQAAMIAIRNLAAGASNKTRFVDVGSCEEVVVAVLRLHGSKSAAVCEASMKAIANLAGEVAPGHRLRDFGACEEVMAALRLHGPTSAALCEAGMKAIRSLASDAISRDCLRDASACEEVIAVLRLHGPSSEALCQESFRLISRFALGGVARARLRDAGVCEEVMAALRMHGPTSVSVCKSSMWAIRNLAKDDFTRTRLRDAGACEAVTAMSRLHGPTNAAVCEALMEAFRELARDSVANVLLRDASACEEVIAALRVHGSNSSSMCKESIRAIIMLARDDVAMARFRNGGACEEIVIALRLHGPTDIAMCEKGVKAIRTLGTDAVTKHRLRDAGACEEVVAALRLHGPTSTKVCEESLVAIQTLATKDDGATSSRLRDAGACEEVVAVLRLHGPTSASVCEKSLGAIQNLATTDAGRARLRDAGACEEIISACRLHGRTSAPLCAKIMGAIPNLSRDGNARARLRDGGICEEVTVALLLHGSTSSAVCEKGMKVIRAMAKDDACRACLRDAGVCKELVRMLQAHAHHLGIALFCASIIASFASRDAASKAKLLAAGAREALEAIAGDPAWAADVKWEIAYTIASLD